MAVGSASLLDDEAQDERAPRPGYPIDPWRVWLSIKRGWKLLPISICGGALVGVLSALLFVPRVYKSEAVLIWEPDSTQQGPMATRDLSTQAGILKTRLVLENARQRLKLRAPVDVIAKQIEVWFDLQSNLVTIETSTPSAKGAYQLADALVTSFLEHQRTLSRTRRMELIASLEGEVKAASRQRDEAQAAYDAFRAAHGIGDFEFDSQHALEELQDLRKEASDTQADVSALDARTEQLDQISRSQPRMRTQSAMRSDPGAERVAALRTDLAQAKARLAPDHPRLAALSAQLAAAEREVASGASAVNSVTSAPDPAFDATQSNLATARADRAAAAQRKEALKDAIAKAEERVNALNTIAGEARKLTAEVKSSAERAQDLTAELTRAQETEPSVAFRLLTPPVTPEYATESKRKLVAFGFTLLAALGCAGFLLVRPARDRKVYTAREAAFWARMPVVGTSTWPRRPQAFKALVDELNDRAMLASGTTLVVASSSEGKTLAGALAAFLGPHPAPMPYTESGDAQVNVPQSAALATRKAGDSAFFAWPGDSDGPTLRRAARMSDRVLILMRSGEEPMLHAASITTRLGRTNNVAIVLVGVAEDLLSLPDRVGDVEQFWLPATAAAA